MLQSILVGLIFLAALIYLGRFLYRQASAGNSDSNHCDKCLPDAAGQKMKAKSKSN